MSTECGVTFSVIIPIYNEAKRAIEHTVQELQTVFAEQSIEYEIILVNDGSDQDCSDIIDELYQNKDKITIIKNPYNLGYGASLKKGILQAQGEFILTTDADGSYPVDRIPTMLSYCDTYNMVVGARTGDDVKIPLFRKPVKALIRWLAIFLTGRQIPDLNSGLRIFRKSLALEFFHLLPSRFSFTITLTLACLTNDYTIYYVPINYYKRIGKSSIKPFHDTVQFFFLVFRIIMYFKPLRFFLLPAFFLLVAGLSYLGWGIIFKKDILDGAIMLLVVGFQVLFTGFLADIITKQNLKKSL